MPIKLECVDLLHGSVLGTKRYEQTTSVYALFSSETYGGLFSKGHTLTELFYEERDSRKTSLFFFFIFFVLDFYHHKSLRTPVI